MGLFPEYDSPHYGKARVITQTEFETIIQERVTNYIPKDGYGSTAGPVTTDAQLRRIWDHRRYPYALSLYVDGAPYWISGVVFSSSDNKGLLRLSVRGNWDNCRPISIIDIDADGKILDAEQYKSLIFVKEGNAHTHNPSHIQWIDIYLKNASHRFRIEDFHGRELSIDLRLHKDDGVDIHLNKEFHPVTVCRCIATCTLSNVKYTFTGQLPYRLSFPNKELCRQHHAELDKLILTELREHLPNFITVNFVSFCHIDGWL